MRPQAAFQSSLVMCVSRSQRAKQSFERLRSWADEALLELPAMELVTVTEGQGALVCGTGAGAPVSGGGVGTESGVGDAAACAASVGNAWACITDLELASTAGCFVSAL